MLSQLLLHKLVLYGLLWKLVNVESSSASVDVCTKDQPSENALVLLQVRSSAEAVSDRRDLAKVVAEEEKQLDAMAAEMSFGGEGPTPSAARFNRVDLHQPGLKTASGIYAAPGIYETRLDQASSFDSGPENSNVAATQGFAPVSFSEYQYHTEAVTIAPAASVSSSSHAKAAGDSCNPPCVHGHGVCHNSICLCRSPYIGDSCRDVDLRATRHLAAVRSVKMITSDPATTFMLLSEVPIVLAMLVVTLCIVAAVLLATFFAHVYFNISENKNDTFGAEETLTQEDYHEAWLRGKKHKAASAI